jgi:hypothetical protein
MNKKREKHVDHRTVKELAKAGLKKSIIYMNIDLAERLLTKVEPYVISRTKNKYRLIQEALLEKIIQHPDNEKLIAIIFKGERI